MMTHCFGESCACEMVPIVLCTQTSNATSMQRMSAAEFPLLGTSKVSFLRSSAGAAAVEPELRFA